MLHLDDLPEYVTERSLRTLLGARRAFTVGGVMYRECTRERLDKALGRRGAGYKDYIATFRDGTRMRLRCTADRRYADLLGPGVIARHLLTDPFVRPGMRALDVRCGTGSSAAWLARRVGPSGAVVALENDRESIEYARHRFDVNNVAFEEGTWSSLDGETEGAFDLVIAFEPAMSSDDGDDVASELWRVLSPGGRVFLGARTPSAVSLTSAMHESPRSFSSDELMRLIRDQSQDPLDIRTLSGPSGDFVIATATKPNA